MFVCQATLSLLSSTFRFGQWLILVPTVAREVPRKGHWGPRLFQHTAGSSAWDWSYCAKVPDLAPAPPLKAAGAVSFAFKGLTGRFPFSEALAQAHQIYADAWMPLRLFLPQPVGLKAQKPKTKPTKPKAQQHPKNRETPLGGTRTRTRTHSDSGTPGCHPAVLGLGQNRPRPVHVLHARQGPPKFSMLFGASFREFSGWVEGFSSGFRTEFGVYEVRGGGRGLWLRPRPPRPRQASPLHEFGLRARSCNALRPPTLLSVRPAQNFLDEAPHWLPLKVEITGVEMVNGQKAFVMRFLQCRDPAWIGRVFFAKRLGHHSGKRFKAQGLGVFEFYGSRGA